MTVHIYVLLSCFLIRFALRHMYLAITSGALTPLCGQPSAKCWVTWLYSYDKSKKIWWAFWHQQMVPCPWLPTFCFPECRVLCWLVVPYGFYLTLPHLIVFRSFFGLWLCACLRAMYRKCSSHIVSSIWLFIVFLLPLNKRGFVLLSGCLGLFLFHSLFCLLVFVRFIEILLPKVFCMTKIHINKTNSQLRKCNWGFLLHFGEDHLRSWDSLLDF